MNAFHAANVTVGLALCYFLSCFRSFFPSSLSISKIENMKMQVSERSKGAVISPSNKMEMSHVERISEEDILFGHLKDQKEYSLRLFQDSCMVFSNPNFATMFPQGPQLWEGSGRHKGNLNPHVGPNVAHPPGIAGLSFTPRGRVPDGMQQPWGFFIHGNEDTLPKSRVGTGTYLPNTVRLTRHQSLEFHIGSALVISME